MSPHNRIAKTPCLSRKVHRAAALVEAVVVVPVLAIIAFNALEFARYAQVRMLVRYAQAEGLRECSVSANHLHNPTGNADGNAKAKDAARAALGPWSGRWFDAVEPPDCDFKGATGEYAPVSFPLTVDYKCSYPLSFCHLMNRQVQGTAGLSMPMQTAYYAKQSLDPYDGPQTPCQKGESGYSVDVHGECVATTSTDAGAPPPAMCAAATAAQTNCSSTIGGCFDGSKRQSGESPSQCVDRVHGALVSAINSLPPSCAGSTYTVASVRSSCNVTMSTGGGGGGVTTCTQAQRDGCSTGYCQSAFASDPAGKASCVAACIAGCGG